MTFNLWCGLIGFIMTSGFFVILGEEEVGSGQRSSVHLHLQNRFTWTHTSSHTRTAQRYSTHHFTGLVWVHVVMKNLELYQDV